MGIQPHQLIEQGIQQAEIGNLEAALEFLQKALAIYQEIGNRYWKIVALDSLGGTYLYYLKNYAKAIEYLEQALAIAKEIIESRIGGSQRLRYRQRSIDRGGGHWTIPLIYLCWRLQYNCISLVNSRCTYRCADEAIL